MCVKAVLAVADLERKDVNLDLIKVESKVRVKRTRFLRVPTAFSPIVYVSSICAQIDERNGTRSLQAEIVMMRYVTMYPRRCTFEPTLRVL